MALAVTPNTIDSTGTVAGMSDVHGNGGTAMSDDSDNGGAATDAEDASTDDGLGDNDTGYTLTGSRTTSQSNKRKHGSEDETAAAEAPSPEDGGGSAVHEPVRQRSKCGKCGQVKAGHTCSNPKDLPSLRPGKQRSRKKRTRGKAGSAGNAGYNDGHCSDDDDATYFMPLPG